MSYQQQIFDIIQGMTGNRNLLVIPRELVKLTGSLSTALFLSQLMYWSDKGSRSDGFIFKSNREWQEETMLTDYAIRTATKKLKEMGILETKLKRANCFPTVHYRIVKEELVKRLFEINNTDSVNSTNT